MSPDAPVATPQSSPAHLLPAETQILLVDLQTAIIGNSQTRSANDITRAALGLVRVAETLDLPCWYSVAAQSGTDPALVEALRPYATSDQILERVTAGAFMDHDTVRKLAETGRPNLIVAGVASEVVVLQSALDAQAMGYNVFYAVDAIGGLSERSEQAVFRTLDTAGAQASSVISLAARLAPDFSAAPGTDILEIIMSLIAD